MTIITKPNTDKKQEKAGKQLVRPIVHDSVSS